MKLRSLVDAFVEAIFGPPPVADLETVTLVIGGSAAMVSPMGGRYGAAMVSRATGEETYWLQKDKTGGWWNLAHRDGDKPEGGQNSIIGMYGTLEEAVPHLRELSDKLADRQGGWLGAAGGALYFEPDGEDSLAAVERAIALKTPAPGGNGPQPRV